MRKTVAIILTLALCFATLGAYAEQSPAADTFSCFVTLDADVLVDDNKVLEWFEEENGVGFDFVVSTGDEMLTLLLSSGDYPEIIINSFNNDDIVNYGINSGIFVPIDEYMDEHMPNLSAYLAEHETFRRNITAPDGHIYGIPQLPASFSHANIGRKLWINTQWLENLGLEMPQTTDALFDVLVAFRDNDPNGNGIADEIPLSGCINTWNGEPEYAVMQSFVYCNTDSFVAVQDGQVQFVANTDAYREGLTYLKKLYDENLLDPASFTQDLNQLTQLGQNPGIEILGTYACGHVGMALDLADTERSRMYNPLVTPASPEGRRVALFFDPENASGTQFAVTDACHDIPRALQIIDKFFEEEVSIAAEYGLRGINWDYAEEGMLDSEGEQALYMTLNTRVELSTELRDNLFLPFRFSDTARTKYWVGDGDIYDNSTSNYENRLYQASMEFVPYLPEETMPVIWATQDEAEAHARIRVTITDYVKQATTRFITGDMNLETEWDAYVAALEGMSLDAYMQYYQDGYAAAKAK